MKTSFTFLFVFFLQVLSAQNIPLYVGTYNESGSKGIYYYDFNSETGKLTNKKLAVEALNASFLAISSNRKYLYTTSKTDDQKGFINAYAVQNDNSLMFLNSVSSRGDGPCHIQLNEADTKLVVSNYGGGTIAVCNINQTNGTIEDAFQVIDHNTPGIKSHAHSAKFLNNNLFVADLGRDFLAQYVEDEGSYLLKKNYDMAPKAGPRHFDISKGGNYIYVINELNSTITALKKGAVGTYTEIQTISTLKDGYIGMNACADIHLSKDEKFLYGSNRGENSIVVYKRNTEDGMLEKIQSIFVEGDWPRNFTLTPNGKFLLVANRRSNNISVYKVGENTGTLTYLYTETTSAPVCLLF
ncbi:6-phosphogluconolactonase [Lutibacter agarilyticus]|uniref:6-phosphogluconolactonase n=1 Tax=Lutibacter agarilyticus TaxID=1109740 RepID=A0A238W2A9_9FLAO|nr:lactonase family protein [Lutibacter agarilyticus]SNR40690.1 6-phosphogluconolactonase [Lutibacter agarilyticus]